MALRQIVKDTDPQIRKHSREVTAFDQKLATLLDDMRETMLKNDGVGLAGVQVGILRRIAVVETSSARSDSHYGKSRRFLCILHR